MSCPAPIRVVHTPLAPSPRRLAIFLAEKGIEIPGETIDIMKGEHKTPEYLAWAGAPTVPVLELEDGTVLTETVSISRYIEALYPEPNLMGRDPLEIAKIDMWQRRMELRLWLQVTAVVRHLNRKMAALEDQVPEWGESNRRRLDTTLRQLNERLKQVPWVAGERYTIADITAFVSTDFMRVGKVRIPEDCEALQAWSDRVRQRPAVSG